MANVQLALQRAVVERLKAYAPLAALIGARVYDRVPENAAAPYLHVFDIQTVEADAGCIEADEATVTLQIWDEDKGRVRLRRIAGHVRDALHHHEADLLAHGCALIEMRVVDMRDFLEADGITSRAIVTLRAHVERV